MTTGSENEQQMFALPQASMKALSECGTVKAYPKNAILVSEGDRGDSLYVVLSGKVKIYLADEEGKEVVLNVQGPGEYFGELMLDEGPRSASVMTLEPSKFAVLSRDQFKAFLAGHPEAAFEVVTNLIHRIRSLTKTVGDLALLDVYGRVAKLLLELATDVDGRSVVTEHLTQQDIASRVGCSREMISRILRDLRIGGYIEMDGPRMVVVKKPPRAW